MAEDMIMKLAGETAHRLNERLFREERERQDARVKQEAAVARMRLAEDDVLRCLAEQLNAGTLH